MTDRTLSVTKRLMVRSKWRTVTIRAMSRESTATWTKLDNWKQSNIPPERKPDSLPKPITCPSLSFLRVFQSLNPLLHSVFQYRIGPSKEFPSRSTSRRLICRQTFTGISVTTQIPLLITCSTVRLRMFSSNSCTIMIAHLGTLTRRQHSPSNSTLHTHSATCSIDFCTCEKTHSNKLAVEQYIVGTRCRNTRRRKLESTSRNQRQHRLPVVGALVQRTV